MDSAIEIRPHPEGAVLEVRVSPGSSREAVLGEYGTRLKVAVRAPPERGRANRALVKLLTRVLHLPRGRVEILSGGGSSDKTVLVRGARPEDLQEEIRNLVRQRR